MIVKGMEELEKLIGGSVISYFVTKNIYVHIVSTVASSPFQGVTVLYRFIWLPTLLLLIKYATTLSQETVSFEASGRCLQTRV